MHKFFLIFFLIYSFIGFNQIENDNVFKYVYSLKQFQLIGHECDSNNSNDVKFDSCKTIFTIDKYLTRAKNNIKLKNTENICIHLNKKFNINVSEKFNYLNNLQIIIIFSNNCNSKINFKSTNGLNSLKHFTTENIFFNKLPEFIYNSPNLESLAYYVDKNHEIDFYKLSKLDSLKRLLIVNAKEQNTSLNIDYMYDLKVETLELALFSPVEIDIEKLKKMKNLKRLFINIKNEEVLDEIRKLGIKVNDDNY
jgi:hypothetical protein